MAKTPKRARRLEPGTAIAGRYRILDIVGSGAVGTVVYASDEELDREITALKVLHPHLALDEKALARFQNEVMIARQLSHPNIVRVYDFAAVKEEGLYFITMEFVRGPNLREYTQIHKGRKLSFEDTLRVLYQLATALSFAHQKGIVHRDLKPENVLLAAEGDAKLSDFGLANSLQSSLGLTQTGEALGTPLYMSPEALRAEPLGPRSDIYALGILAYELVAGRPPFAETNYYALAQQHFTEVPPEAPLIETGVPRWFIAFINRATAKDPNERFANAQEIAGLLQDRGAESLTVTALKLPQMHRTQIRRVYCPPRLLCLVRICIWLAIIASYYGMLSDHSSRSNLLWQILRLEQAYAVDLSPVRKVFKLGSWTVHDHTSALNSVTQDDVKALFALARAGARLNEIDGEGNTPLHLAALKNRPNHLNILLRFGADPNVQNNAGDLPTHIALKGGNHDVLISLLQAGANINARDRQGNSVLHLAANDGQPQLVSAICANAAVVPQFWRRNGSGLTPLHIAVLRNDPATVVALTAAGADPNVLDGSGRTPLALAQTHVQGDSEETAAALVRAGANRAFADIQRIILTADGR